MTAIAKMEAAIMSVMTFHQPITFKSIVHQTLMIATGMNWSFRMDIKEQPFGVPI